MDSEGSVVETVLDREAVLGTGGLVSASGTVASTFTQMSSLNKISAAGPVAPYGRMTPPIVYADPGYVVAPDRASAGVDFVMQTVWHSQFIADEVADAYEESRRQRFAYAQSLAQQLERATTGLSSMGRAARHPAYVDLMAIATTSLGVILERLRGTQRPLWLFFLQQAVPDRPAEGAGDIDAAAQAWLRWGQVRGYLR